MLIILSESFLFHGTKHKNHQIIKVEAELRFLQILDLLILLLKKPDKIHRKINVSAQNIQTRKKQITVKRKTIQNKIG